MPHELRGMDRMPHEFFSAVLIAGVLFVAVLAAFVAYLSWKHRKKWKEENAARPTVRRRVRKRKRH
jgi:hypothetical protein